MTGKAGSFLLVLCLLLGVAGKLQSNAVLGHSNVFNLQTFTEEENSESKGFRLIEETNIFSLNTKDKSSGEEISSGLSLLFETNLFSLNTKPYEDPLDPSQSNSSFSLVFETEIFGLNTNPKDSGPPSNGTKRIGGTLTIVQETEIFPLSTHPIFRPLIDTLRPTEMENGNILLEAEILSAGGLPILDQGFEISRHGNFMESFSYSAAYNPLNGFFSYLLSPPDRKEGRYFRAFARNAVGLKYGETHKLTDFSPYIFLPWEDAERMENGWMDSVWFGTFVQFENGWMYHSSLGWLFSHSDANQGIWLWFGPENWLWTQKFAYPYFFKWESKDWLYLIHSDETKNSFISDKSKEFVSISKGK